jgi:small-conductance mechanosensitive channel/CRP-like cAMP-binding protein
MAIGSDLLAEIKIEKTLELTLVTLGLLAFARALPVERRRRIRGDAILFALYLLLVLVASWLRATGSTLYREARVAGLVFATLAIIGLAGSLLFGVLLPRVRMNVPRIVQDVIVAAASTVAVFLLMSRAGWNLSGLIATSAVLTAVIGLSFQDTLGNIVGGLALELDDSVRVGDWIKVGDVTGRVSEIRWRYTAVETRNWETVILPNSMLVKGQVTVLGRREGQPLQLRRWVYFNVDFRYPPSQVIQVVTDALKGVRLERVAENPPPNCVLMDLGQSDCRYAVRYWLTDIAVDDPTDSLVRTRIYFALRRANIPLSIPAQAVFVTQDSHERRVEKNRTDLERRLTALARVDLFSHLSNDERAHLAEHLTYAPFAPGETVTRQGAEAHWLYLVVEGEVSVHISKEGVDREVARLHAGDVFGERGLLTGERRSATVVAMTPVVCYRLDKPAFQELLTHRPEIAERLADILAKRQMELRAISEDLDEETGREQLRASRTDLLDKIRSFFGLDEEPFSSR